MIKFISEALWSDLTNKVILLWVNELSEENIGIKSMNYEPGVLSILSELEPRVK